MASELAFAVGATFRGDDRLIKLICTESREITENGVFFAKSPAEWLLRGGKRGLTQCRSRCSRHESRKMLRFTSTTVAPTGVLKR